MTYEEMRTRFAVGRKSAEEGDNQANAFELTRGMADDGSEVFAFINTKAGPKVERYEGPTLRDQFAMAALIALLEPADRSRAYNTKLWLTRSAYGFADAMLEARMPKGNEE